MLFPGSTLELVQEARAEALAGAVGGEKIGDFGGVGEGGQRVVWAEEAETQQASGGVFDSQGWVAFGQVKEPVDKGGRHRLLGKGTEAVLDVVVEQIEHGRTVGRCDGG